MVSQQWWRGVWLCLQTGSGGNTHTHAHTHTHSGVNMIFYKSSYSLLRSIFLLIESCVIFENTTFSIHTWAAHFPTTPIISLLYANQPRHLKWYTRWCIVMIAYIYRTPYTFFDFLILFNIKRLLKHAELFSPSSLYSLQMRWTQMNNNKRARRQSSLSDILIMT